MDLFKRFDPDKNLKFSAMRNFENKYFIDSEIWTNWLVCSFFLIRRFIEDGFDENEEV